MSRKTVSLDIEPLRERSRKKGLNKLSETVRGLSLTSDKEMFNLEAFRNTGKEFDLLDDDRFNKLLTNFEQRVEGIRRQSLLTQTRRQR